MYYVEISGSSNDFGIKPMTLLYNSFNKQDFSLLYLQELTRFFIDIDRIVDIVISIKRTDGSDIVKDINGKVKIWNDLIYDRIHEINDNIQSYINNYVSSYDFPIKINNGVSEIIPKVYIQEFKPKISCIRDTISIRYGGYQYIYCEKKVFRGLFKHYDKNIKKIGLYLSLRLTDITGYRLNRYINGDLTSIRHRSNKDEEENKDENEQSCTYPSNSIYYDSELKERCFILKCNGENYFFIRGRKCNYLYICKTFTFIELIFVGEHRSENVIKYISDCPFRDVKIVFS